MRGGLGALGKVLLGSLGCCVALVGLMMMIPAAPAAAQSANRTGSWRPGPGAVGDSTYLGGIDSPGNGATLPLNRLVTISGWFVDTTAQGWPGADRVQVFLGTMDNGTSLGDATLGLGRPDIASSLGNVYWSSAGWSATVDPASLAGGQNTVSVYAHTPDKGLWLAQVTVTVVASTRPTGADAAPMVSTSGVAPSSGTNPTSGATPTPAAAPAAAAPTPGVVPTSGVAPAPGAWVAGAPPLITVAVPIDGQRVSTRTANLKLNGQVRDPTGGPRAIDWVELWLDGEQNSTSANTYFLGVADLASDGSWSLDFSPFAYPAITSNLYVYAHSGLTGRTGLTVVHFDIVDHPL